MRKTIFALIPALALGVAACSPSAESNLNNSLERTGDSLENSVNDMGNTLGNAADDAGAAIDNTADDVGNRAEHVGNAIDEATR
ncbi:hypothetical protein HZY97_08975 [Sphingomonas sp. R-74633]|uniref:hypothetical protein n=1 Tax=Sphingomonas sp. R-74633 TaxID=2751188 RepID=UPI0015D42A65|nr:hypothetical protein [Sphingomonas sp. R-74633]NYT40885.1 hypothetical protein [Sphingomonas sp. R-74633]